MNTVSSLIMYWTKPDTLNIVRNKSLSIYCIMFDIVNIFIFSIVKRADCFSFIKLLSKLVDDFES